MTATTDFKIAAASLADWGRQELHQGRQTDG